MKQQRKLGMSLPVVLITMVLATLVGTTLYKVLAKDNITSGAQMHHASAVASSKAGLEATKAWFMFHALETKGMLETFRDERANNNNKPVPLVIDVEAGVDATSRQRFRVFLTDVFFASSTAEVSVKVQVVGYGKDGAVSVLSAVLKLDGIVTVLNNIETPLLNEKFIGDNDAIHVSGAGSMINTGGGAHGSLYLGGDVLQQSALNVDNDLVIAAGTSSSTINHAITVQGNAYFGGHIELQNGDINVGKSARFRYINVGGKKVNVGNGADGGDLWVDSVVNTSGGGLIEVFSQGGNLGNIRLNKYYNGNAGGTMRSHGDLEIASTVPTTGMVFDATVGEYIESNEEVWINTGANPDGSSRFQYKGSHAFYAAGAEIPTYTGSATGTALEGPVYGSINPRDYVTMANDLSELEDKLNASSKKPLPYELDLESFQDYDETWQYWRNLASPGCTYQNPSYALKAEEWNCVHSYIVKNYPDKMKNGYLFVNLTGASFNTNYVGTGVLSHNFIFRDTDSPNPTNLWGNTSDSRVVWWFPNGAGQATLISVPAQDIYGVIFTEGDLDVGGAGLRVHGQVLTAKNGKFSGNGGPIEAWFDKAVLNDLASMTGVMVGDAINTGTQIDDNNQGVEEFYPLGPTLKVRSLAESFTEAMVDTTNRIVLGPGIVFMPAYTTVPINYPNSVTQMIAEKGVRVVYTHGASEGTCSFAPTGGDPSAWTSIGQKQIKFNVTCGGNALARQTTFNVYVLPEGIGVDGKGVVRFKDDYVREVEELQLQTGVQDLYDYKTYEFHVIQNIQKLDGTARLSFDFSGSVAKKCNTCSEASNCDFVLRQPALGYVDYADNATTIAPISLQLDICTDNVSNETDEAIRVTMVANNANLRVTTPTLLTVLVKDQNFTSHKLTWSDQGSPAHGTVDVTTDRGNPVLNMDGTWQIRSQALVTLRAKPDENYTVATWTGCTVSSDSSFCTINPMDADKSFGLTFKKKVYSLTLRPQSVVGGTVSFNQTPLTSTVVGSDRVMTFEAGTAITATATAHAYTTSPLVKYLFMGWTGYFAGRTESPLTFSLDSNMVIGGAFVLPGQNCYYDSFTGYSSNWRPAGSVLPLLSANSTWSMSGSWLRAVGSSTSPPVLLFDKDTQKNGKVEIKVVSADTASWRDGLVLRYNESDGSYVSVGYRNAPYEMNRILFCNKEVGKAEVCTEHANHMEPASSVDLAVAAMESNFVVYINSKWVATLYAAGHDDAGKSGFIARRPGANDLASTYKWIDGLGCSSTNNLPVVKGCYLETATSSPTTADPLVIKQGESFYFRATVEDEDGLKEDAVRYMLTTSDGYALPEVVNVEYQIADVTSKDLVHCSGGFCTSQKVSGGAHKGLGSYYATLVVKDLKGAEASCEKKFTVISNTENTPPVLDGILVNGSTYNDGELTLPLTLNLSVSATDADGDALKFIWTGDLGEWVENGTSSSTSTFTVNPGTGGTRSVTVTVSDGKGGETTAQLRLNLVASNRAPVIRSCLATPSSGEAPLKVKFTSNANDPDGDVLTYSWLGGDGVNMSGEFPADFIFKSAANHSVRLIVTDSHAASDTCNLTISTTPSTNRPPRNALCSVDKNSGTGGLLTVKFTGSAVDPDGDPLNFRWTLSNGEVVWGNPYTKVLGSGSYVVKGAAVDSKGAEAQCAPLSINNANTKPTISLSATPTNADMTLDENGDEALLVQFTVTAKDADGDEINKLWTVSPSTGGNCDTSKAQCTFTTAGVYTVTVTATDSKGGTNSASKVITVTQNAAPTVTCSVSPASPMIGEEVTWTATAVDSDGDPLIATWSGTDGLSGSSKAIKTTYSTTGTKTATIVVKDEGKLEATATCQTTVVAYVSPCGVPVTMASGTDLTIPPQKSICYKATGVSYNGYQMGVQNYGLAPIVVKWWGNTDPNNSSSCSMLTSSLGAADAWRNNGGKIDQNNAGLDRSGFKTDNPTTTGDAYVLITNTSTTTAATFQFTNLGTWQNGSGCSTDATLAPDGMSLP